MTSPFDDWTEWSIGQIFVQLLLSLKWTDRLFLAPQMDTRLEIMPTTSVREIQVRRGVGISFKTWSVGSWTNKFLSAFIKKLRRGGGESLNCKYLFNFFKKNTVIIFVIIWERAGHFVYLHLLLEREEEVFIWRTFTLLRQLFIFIKK